MESSEQMDEMISTIASAARDSRRYLLTDDTASGIVQALIDSGHLAVPGRAMSNASEAQLNAGFVGALPVLPEASLAQVMEIREDLRVPLGAYRTEVAALAESVRSSPYSEDMSAEVAHAWGTKVEPALNDLQVSMGNNAVVQAVLKRAGLSTVGPLVGTSLYVAGSIFFGVMPSPETLLAYMTTGAIGGIVGQGAIDRMDKQEVGRTKPFYFLYEANRRVTAWGARRSVRRLQCMENRGSSSCIGVVLGPGLVGGPVS